MLAQTPAAPGSAQVTCPADWSDHLSRMAHDLAAGPGHLEVNVVGVARG